LWLCDRSFGRPKYRIHVARDPQAKLPRVQDLAGSLSFGALATGSAQAGVTIIADTTIPNQTYVLLWQDPTRERPLGPRGNDRLKVASVYTGPFGHPTGPTGGHG
jgi:hypothetical protein